MRILLGAILGIGGLGGALAAQAPALEARREWPFSKPLAAPPPAVRSAERAENAIDRFILEKLEAKRLTLAPEAPRRTLARRLYFDLLGLPPPPEEADAFAGDPDPLAYEALVDRLLADPRYGERWARFWLDLARYADTAGYEGDPDLPHAWRYRDYAIDAFNDDKPYDLFIKEQIAGDEMEEILGAGDLPAAGAEETVALTFLRLAPFTEPRGDESRHEMLSEMTATVSSVFLGLTAGCAECHDHKYDGIPTKDFYRLKAFFATVQIPRPLPGDVFQIGGPLPAAFYRPGEKEWADELRARRERELAEARALLAALAEAAKRAEKGAAPSAEDAARRSELAGRIRACERDLERLKPLAMSLRHSYGPPYEPGVPATHVLIRGEWDKPGERVEPGFPSLVTGHQEPARIRLDPFRRWPTRSRRMALADWIASPENPLTARVLVNRLWAWRFGRGIVATPSDFGKLGGGPSHPELLDWMAERFIRSGWSIKSMQRRIVTSATYRQSSESRDAEAPSLDPENVLLWRFPRRRLEAEAIRDAVLAASGRLNLEQHGLPIFPPLPGGIAEAVKWNDSKWAAQHGPEGRKRSVYIYQQRSLTMPLLQAFDGIVCDASRDRRQPSVTPLQALAMANGDFVNEEARHLASRVHRERGEEPAARVRGAFRIAFARDPDAEELERLSEHLAACAPGDGLERLCRVLLNANEFITID
jgi:hypothetical protein